MCHSAGSDLGLLYSKDIFKFEVMKYPHKPKSLRVCLQTTYLSLLLFITTTTCIIFSEISLVRVQVLPTMYKIFTYFLSA